MSKPLVAEGIDVVFGSGRNAKTALRDVSLAVGGVRPSITAIVGESGSGKTTLTRVLLGFQPPTHGSIVYDGKPLSGMGRAGQRQFRREVQAIFQDPFDVFNPFYRVDHALIPPLRGFGLARSKAEAYGQAETALETVGLRPAETLGKYPHQLSGGQRQRVMIARALSLKPSIILADEPVSMVDASLRSTILEMLYKLNREAGISLIYVTHDLTTAYQVAETIVVLYGGMVMEVGTAAEVIHRPRHPYTRALLDAVPSPDPDVPWGLETAETADRSAAPSAGCPFAPRCPHVMEKCRLEVPALYPTGPAVASACFLHETAETTNAAAVQIAAQAARGAAA